MWLDAAQSQAALRSPPTALSPRADAPPAFTIVGSDEYDEVRTQALRNYEKQQRENAELLARMKEKKRLDEGSVRVRVYVFVFVCTCSCACARVCVHVYVFVCVCSFERRVASPTQSLFSSEYVRERSVHVRMRARVCARTSIVLE